MVGAHHPQTADQDRHLGRRQAQQLRPVDQQLLGRDVETDLQIIAEPVGAGLQHLEAVHVGLLLRGVGAARREGDSHVVTAGPGRLLDADHAAQDNQVGHGDVQAARRLDVLIDLEDPGQLRGFVDVPVLLRGQTQASAVGAAAIIRAAIGDGRGPGCRDQISDRQTRGLDAVLQRADVGVRQLRSRVSRDRVLPDQVLGRNVGTEIAGLGPHVAVTQLEPGPGELVAEIGRVGAEPLHDGAIDRVDLEGHVGGRHHRRHALARRMGGRSQGFRRIAHRLPLLGARRTADQLIVVIQQHVEIGHVPGDRRRGPGPFDARGDGVVADAAGVARNPAEPLLGDVGALGTDAHLGSVAGAMGLAEGMAPGGQGGRLLVVHAHAGEGLANVAGRGQGLGHAAGAFRVDVDEAHLDGGQRVFQHHALVGLDAGFIALFADPAFFRAPVDVLLGLPDVGAAAAEAEDRPAHRLDGDIAGQDHQVGPAELGAVLLLDRPQQAARLVQVAVVRPGVERGEPLLARAGAAASVPGAIGAGRVPGHANEEGAVVAVVGRPPGLAVGHQGGQIALHRFQVQRLEGLGIVEVVAHRVARLALLMQDIHRQLIGPPVAVGASQKRTQRARLLLGIVERGGAACLSVHDFPPVQQIMARAYARFGTEGKSIKIGVTSNKTYGGARCGNWARPLQP